MSNYGETPTECWAKDQASRSRSGSHPGSQTGHSITGPRPCHRGIPEAPYYESSLINAYSPNRTPPPASQCREPPNNYAASSVYSRSQGGRSSAQTWTTLITRSHSPRRSERGSVRGERVPPEVPEEPRLESGSRYAPPSEASYAGTVFPTVERVGRDAERRDAERRREGQGSQRGTERRPRSEAPRSERGGPEYHRSEAPRSEYDDPNLPYSGSQAPRSERGGGSQYPQSKAPRSERGGHAYDRSESGSRRSHHEAPRSEYHSSSPRSEAPHILYQDNNTPPPPLYFHTARRHSDASDDPSPELHDRYYHSDDEDSYSHGLEHPPYRPDSVPLFTEPTYNFPQGEREVDERKKRKGKSAQDGKKSRKGGEIRLERGKSGGMVVVKIDEDDKERKRKVPGWINYVLT